MNKNGIFINKFKTIIMLTAVIFLIAALGSIQVVRAVGKSNLRGRAETYVPVVKTEWSEPLSKEEETVWRDGFIKHNDKIYVYNEDILSFLLMGDRAADLEQAGSDTLLLVVLNPHDSSIHMLEIDPAMLQNKYEKDEDPRYETVMDSVSELLFSIPIHGYVAVGTETLSAVREAVGDADALPYESGQEMRDFIDTVQEAVASGTISETALCQILLNHARTNMTLNEAAYMAPLMKEYGIADESYIALQKDGLFDFTIRMFYEEVG